MWKCTCRLQVYFESRNQKILCKWSLGDQELGGKVKLGKCLERMDKRYERTQDYKENGGG